MELTDKEYLELIQLTELATPDESITGCLKNVEAMDYMELDKMGIYAYKNEYDDRLIIFTYKGMIDNEVNDWVSLFAGGFEKFEDVRTFIQQNKGSSQCTVTGHAIGGAYASYAAATFEGMCGIVFDAPGIGQFLTDEQKQNLQVKNYVSSSMMIAALGEHCEKVIFAGKADNNQGQTASALIEKYNFDLDGNMIPGQMGELFQLADRINALTADMKKYSQVMHAFALETGLEHEFEDFGPVILLELMSRLDVFKLKNALHRLEKSFDRMTDELVASWSKSIDESSRIEDIDQRDEQIMALTEDLYEQINLLGDTLYQTVEDLLSIFVIYSSEIASQIGHMEEQMDHFINEIDRRMGKRVTEITDHLDQLMETLYLSEEIRDLEVQPNEEWTNKDGADGDNDYPVKFIRL